MGQGDAAAEQARGNASVVPRSFGRARATGIAGLNQALRRNINKPRGYTPPVELAAQRVRAKH